MSDQPKIRYDIEAAVSGDSDVNRLAAELEKLDGSIDPALAERARTTAQSLRELGQTQAAVQQFVELRNATARTATELATAQTAVDRFTAEMGAAENPTRAQATQLGKLSAALKEAEDAHGRNVVALAREEQALRAAGVETTRLEATQVGLYQQLQETEQALRQLAGEGALAAIGQSTQQVASELQQAEAAVQAFAQKLTAAEGPTEAEAQQLKQLSTTLEKGRDALQSQVDTLERHRAALTAAGVPTDALQKQQAELAGSLTTTAAQIERLDDAYQQAQAAQREFAAQQKAAAEAVEAEARAQQEFAEQAERARRIVQQSDYRAMFDQIEQQADEAAAAQKRLTDATKRVSDAFGLLGIKSRASIEADIVAINTALDTLARNSRISGDEFDRAFNAGQVKIKALRGELDGVAAPAEAGSKGIGLMSSAVGQLAGAFSAYEAGRFVVNAINDLEQMRRVLTLVTGSTETAAQQLQFLRDVANEAGVASGQIGDAFAKFVASTQAAGISLKTSNEAFAAVTRAAGTLGLSSADAEAALRALGQMASKGKVSMEELSQQLGERLPAVLATTAQGLGVTTSQLTKLVESGKVLADEEFFAAFSRGLNAAFVDGAQKVDGLSASFARMKNAATEAVGVFADGGGADAMKGAMVALATAIGPVLLGISALFDGVTTGARQLGTVVAALVTRDFANLGPTLNKQMDDMVERQSRMSEIFQRAIGLADGAKAATQGHAQALQGAATAAQQTAQANTDATAATENLATALGRGASEAAANAQAQGASASAATANATAQAQAGAATATAGDQAAGAGGSWLRLTSVYKDAQTALEKQITAQAERVKAAEKEGALLVQIADLTGNEAAKREAAATAAQGQAAASSALATSQAQLVASQQAELAALEEYVRRNGDAGGQRLKQIDTLRQEIEQSRAKRDAMQAEASGLELLADRRRVEIQLAQDNSGKLAELRGRYDEARQTVEAYRILLDRGAISQTEFNAKMAAAAGAANLYRDALSDLGRKIEQTGQLKQADINVSNAKISVTRQEAEAALRMAEATGNEAAATDAKVKIKQAEIESIKNKVAAAQAEHDTALAKIEADRKEAEQTGALTPEKERELEIRLKNADAKLIEAQGSGKVVAGLEAEISALRNKATVAAAAAAAGTSQTAGVIGQADQSPNTDFRSVPVGAKDNGDGTYTDAFGETFDKKTGQSKGKTANSGGGFSGPIDNTTRDDLFKRFDAGTLTANDRKAAEAVLAAAQTNQQAFNKAGWDNRGFMQTTDKARAVLERIASLEELSKRSSNTGNTTHNVNITLGGKTTTINTASAADANSLADFMKQLQAAAGVAQ